MKAMKTVGFLIWFIFLSVSIADTDEELRQKVRAKVGDQIDFFERDIERVGNKTVQFEGFAATEGEFDLAQLIYSNHAKYARWMMKSINIRPDGTEYFLKMMNLWVEAGTPDILQTLFRLDIPLFNLALKRGFRMRYEKSPRSLTLFADSLPDEKAHVESASGFVKIFPSDRNPLILWMYARGTIRFRNRLLYEALPNRLLRNETGERLKIIFQNYWAEESRVRDERIKSNQTPKEKTAAQAEPVKSLRQKQP